MFTPGINSEKLTIDHHSFLPTPSQIILIYSFLWYLFFVNCMCCMVPTCDFLMLPHYAGLNLLDLFTVVNVLLALYLLVSAWSFAQEKTGPLIRKIAYWLIYTISLVFLILIQSLIYAVEDEIQLPDEILNLSRSEFLEMSRSERLEDIVLPKSATFNGFPKPSETRCIVTLIRSGCYVENRRVLGHVDETLPLIREHILSDINKLARNPDGSTDLKLQIRADRRILFKEVFSVMRLCNDLEININNLQFSCISDLRRMAPETAKKLKWYYLMPEGKIDVRPPETMDSRIDTESALSKNRIEDELVIDLFFDKRSKEGFFIKVSDYRFEGSEMISFQYLIKRQHANHPGCRAIIIAHGYIEHGQVIKTYSECLSAGITDLILRYSSD